MPPTEGAAKSASRLSSSSPTHDAHKTMTSLSLSPETSMICVDNDNDDVDVDVTPPASSVVKKLTPSSAQKFLKTSVIPDISYSR